MTFVLIKTRRFCSDTFYPSLEFSLRFCVNFPTLSSSLELMSISTRLFTSDTLIPSRTGELYSSSWSCSWEPLKLALRGRRSRDLDYLSTIILRVTPPPHKILQLLSPALVTITRPSLNMDLCTICPHGAKPGQNHQAGSQGEFWCDKGRELCTVAT